MTDPGASRHPEWLRVRVRPSPAARQCERVLGELGVETVCRSCRCPNTHECWDRGTATFMILGTTCTRACGFCAVSTGAPRPVQPDEPSRVAAACKRLALRHVVVTSVTRDDLPDGGASQFAATAQAVRRELPTATVELLVPDFQGCEESLQKVLASHPDVLGHNVETVPRLYRVVRSRADYRTSLGLLDLARRRDGVRTKGGFMLGLGETPTEVRAVMADLREAGCEILTIGQYLPPSRRHLPVARLVPPEEFAELAAVARDLGFAAVAAGPLVRSSYRAAALLAEAAAAAERAIDARWAAV